MSSLPAASGKLVAVGKKAHPLGVCKTCGGITYSAEVINKRCGRSPNGHRCSGRFANAARDSDWKVCSSCDGTGVQGKTACVYCRGIGWNLSKPWII